MSWSIDRDADGAYLSIEGKRWLKLTPCAGEPEDKLDEALDALAGFLGARQDLQSARTVGRGDEWEEREAKAAKLNALAKIGAEIKPDDMAARWRAVEIELSGGGVQNEMVRSEDGVTLSVASDVPHD